MAQEKWKMENGKWKMRIGLIIVFVIFFFLPLSASASSEYVLPYPSFMPGSKFYTVHLFWENMMKYWYFGSFSQFDYNLSLSDKYLVEAKTLFEYKQYFLGYKALQKSDKYFINVPESLANAKKENKNISQKQSILEGAALKHIEILEDVKKIVPDQFVWREEKKDAIVLLLKQVIDSSISIRKNI